MATQKQKIAIDKIVENHGNVSKAMREAGYDETTAKNPKNLTDSKGYRELLYKYGLTEDLITKSLVEDIKSNKGKRISELNLGAELLGMRKTGINIANQINLPKDVLIDPEGKARADKAIRDYLNNKKINMDLTCGPQQE